MSLNWINPEEYSFNSFLLMERFQLRLMLQSGGWGNDKTGWRRNMGAALNANPAVKWYFENKCPECAGIVQEITASAPTPADPAEIRKAEVYALASVEDFTAYTRPETLDADCDFIYGWDKQRLFDLAGFAGKVVLDIGSGSGRLAFAAAERAAWVYASEPVDMLREYMRDKISRDGIQNIRVVDGMVYALPYPDDTFDIVMSGHVVGDDWDAEIAEITRVCKSGGWLLDCPGDQRGSLNPSEELRRRGWEETHYVGSFGGDVYCYRKKIWKG
jgi:SAM-dependent methyltransferase